MTRDLRQYLQFISQAGPEYYAEVKRPVSPILEISALQEKLAAEGRFPVLYCGQVAGSKLPLVTNLHGRYDCWGKAFEIDPAVLRKEGNFAILKEHRKRQHNTRPVEEVPASAAPVKEVVLRGEDVDLGLLPIPHHAQLDSGRYITIGSMVCRDPDTGIPNVGVYRHEVKGRNRLGCFINPSNHGSYIARRYAELGRPMEIVLFIGHHPLVVLGSCMRGDMNANEFEVMGGLLGESLQVTRGETVDLPVPAYAEIAIEGTIDPRQWITDGPLAEWTGYYGEQKSCYQINVTAITMRHDAIFHDLDNAHAEHILVMALPHESNAFDAVQKVVPSVQAVHLFPPMLCVKMMAISIKKRVPGEARLAGLAALTSPQVKVAVVVDDDIDVFNEREVLWAAGTRVTADTDMHIIPNILGAPLDPTAYDETRLGRGPMDSKVAIDATRPIELPFETRITPPRDIWESMDLADYV
ncbi:MAG: UbiD family decarboxylase [Chloroflexi bacterium]|nr:UbiD family decarboxylase [Chloroflexota bacterium]